LKLSNNIFWGISVANGDGAPRIDGSAIDPGRLESSFLFVDGFE
jgi:hypothetical protein